MSSRQVSVARRKLIVTGTTAWQVQAAGTSTLAQASKEAQHYTDVEQANLEAMQSYFNGLKTKDVSRIRFGSQRHLHGHYPASRKRRRR